MRRFYLAFLAVGPLLLGCTESTPKPLPPVASAAPSASVAAPRSVPLADAGAPVVTVPESKPTWRSVPKEQNGFYAVLDGLCSKLGASALTGGDLVIHYGGESVFANERSGLASFIGIRGANLESVGEPTIASPTGIAGKSLEDFWLADSTGSRTSEGAVIYRRQNGAWKSYAKDVTNLHPWLDGGVIGTMGFARANGDVWVEDSATKPSPDLAAGLGMFPHLIAFPTGEVVLLGQPADENGNNYKDGNWVARHWSPTTKVTWKPLPWFPVTEYPSEIAYAPDEIYVYDESTLAMFDGTTWKQVAKTTRKEPIRWAGRAAKGDVWVRYESGAMEHSTGTTFTAVPMPEPTLSIAGLDRGAPWAVGISGKLYKRVNETWSEVKMPAPAFGTSSAVKAKLVKVNAPDDVTVIAAYWEKGPGWSEQELHWMLLRTKQPSETMRCNEPDPENNNVYIGRGFQSWPPLVVSSPECKTPFVVLARRSNAKSKTPKETDWKAIRGALKGHGDLGDGKLVEFTSGDRTFLGAKAKDVDSAKKIAALAAAKDRIRPEVVCGEPPATTREVPLE